MSDYTARNDSSSFSAIYKAQLHGMINASPQGAVDVGFLSLILNMPVTSQREVINRCTSMLRMEDLDASVIVGVISLLNSKTNQIM